MMQCNNFYCWYQYFIKEEGMLPEDAEILAEVASRCGEPLPDYFIK